MKTITEAEQFYGYLTGIHVEPGAGPDQNGCVNPNLYASFEYRQEASVWLVPDLELFNVLAEHLGRMAWARHQNGEYGYEKLWIKKDNGRWYVDLP